MRLSKRLHVLQPFTLLDVAKGKGLTVCPINPTYSMANADQVPHAAAQQAIAELNPLAQQVQPAAKVHPAPEIRTAVQVNEGRYRSCWFMMSRWLDSSCPQFSGQFFASCS